MTDQELKDLVASLSVSQKETDRQIAESNKQMKEHSEETDRRIEEIHRQMKEHSAETDKQMKEHSEKVDRQMKELRKETEKQMQETVRILKSVGVQLGNIGRNQGDVAEEFFVNTLGDNLRVAGIKYDEININMHKKVKKNEGEFDIVLINGKDVAIIETKYKAHTTDLEELIQIQHKKFKTLYPQYNDYNHHLGLASFHINAGLKKEALKNNVFVLQRKGNLIETTVPSN